MKIYEIDREIERLLTEVDEETGELIIDPEEIEKLQMEWDRKVENLALAYKNLTAEVNAFKAEEAALAERRKSTESAARKAQNYLEFVLKGEEFKSTKVAVTYSTSKKVELDDDFVAWAQVNAPDFLRYKDPEADKRAIASAIKDGVKFSNKARMVDTTSIKIK